MWWVGGNPPSGGKWNGKRKDEKSATCYEISYCMITSGKLFIADMIDENEELKSKIQEKVAPSDLKIIDFKMTQYALLQLPSGSEIMISMGATTVKFLKKGLLGYVTPKTILSKQIADWDKRYLSHNALVREGVKLHLLTGLIFDLSKIKSENEIEQAIRDGNALGEGGHFHMFSR